MEIKLMEIKDTSYVGGRKQQNLQLLTYHQLSNLDTIKNK